MVKRSHFGCDWKGVKMNQLKYAWMLRARPNRADRGLYGGKEIQYGNTISFSHKVHRKRWLPNVQTKSLYSQILDKTFKLRVTTHTLRCIDKCGGLDEYLLNTKDANIDSMLGLQIKSALKWMQEKRAILQALP